MGLITSLQTPEDLNSFFKDLGKDDVFSIFSESTAFKGWDYYKNQLVQNADLMDSRIFICRVRGSYNPYYKVTLTFNPDGLYGECDCMYGGICKHIAACMFYLSEMAKTNQFPESEKDFTIKNNKDSFKKYLESLSKEELINLVIEYAPEKFRKTIELKDLSGKESGKIVAAIEKKIKKILPVKDYCSSVEVETPLTECLEELSPFYSKEPEHIFNLFIFILKELDTAINEGMFHYDHYDEGNFDYSDLNNFILDFLKNLSSKQKMNYLYEILETSEYSELTYEFAENPDFFTKEDKQNFKPYLLSLNHVSEKFYRIFEQILNFEENEEFLLKHKRNQLYCYQLIKLYKDKNQTEKLVNLIESCIEAFNHNSGFIMDRIILADQLKQDKIPWIDKLIKAYIGGETVQQLFEYIPPEKKAHYEKVLKDKQTEAYISYLELKGRLAEVVEIFDSMKISSDVQENFFKKHKENYPDKAIKIFKQALEKASESTGERAYYQVIEILSQFKSLYSPEKFKDLLLTIKVKYKRRSSLIKMINERFY